MLRVDWRAALGYTGRVLTWFAATLALPAAVALLADEALRPFAATGLFVLAVGLGLSRLGETDGLGPREAILTVALVWFAVGALGALPYVLAGSGTTARPVNAVFESFSGFTTTGATVMASISVETHGAALMLWRQETQWLGGMGIVVLAVALFPELSVGGTRLVGAEAPGPRTQKLTPRIVETARVLWLTYVALTALEVVALYGLHLAGLAPRMDLYAAVAHGFTTMPTGGFSPQARSVAAFSAAVQWVVVPFMVVAGVNFALFYRAFDDRSLAAFREDTEFRAYLGVLGAAVALVAGLLVVGDTRASLAGDGFALARHATFQAISIVTTTGYASADFATWGVPIQTLLVVAMFLGGSAGSTASAVKIVRWVVVSKSIRRTLLTTAHPAAMQPVRLGDDLLDERTVRGVHAFTLLYLLLFVVGTLAVLALGTTDGTSLSALEAASAAAATLGNVGPGVGTVGPMENYLGFPASTKLLLAALMYLGRLEVLTVLVLFTESYWRV
ncbi:TrkH family potassium uptake protein [Halospeciosus flavus]|uniref:TrkH family potassium uptake protein n=1 Tax=Halospeciosus flavus TaxID=3032283 RepID=A0ABD5Z144_9EURY|nr:TrkH family potassium uptake protein [Halospeciosus flavus]